jgi:hypothetical protein
MKVEYTCVNELTLRMVAALRAIAMRQQDQL